jgi:hypothetical protein
MSGTVAILELERVFVGVLGAERVFDAVAFDALSHELCGNSHRAANFGILLGIIVVADVATLDVSLNERLVKFFSKARFAVSRCHVAEACYPERGRIDEALAENDGIGCAEGFRVPNAHMGTFQVPVAFFFRCSFGDPSSVDFSGFALASSAQHWIIHSDSAGLRHFYFGGGCFPAVSEAN